MNFKYLIKNLLISIIILKCEAKLSDTKLNNNTPKTLPQKAIFNCKSNENCSSFYDYLADMAYCNETSNTCINYCFVKTPCTTDLDCNYSIGDSKKCGVECFKYNANDTVGKCLIVSKQGQYCNNNHIICEEDLICDYYTDTCITKAEAQNQSGEPLFSLFLFMLIMLSLFNRQRADEDVLNNMAPNELLMITAPSRRHRPEDDELPVYQPLDSNNEDEIIEQNIELPVLSSNNSLSSTEDIQNQSTEEVGFVPDDDDLPLLPPTYDEAISGLADPNQSPLTNNNENNNNENLPTNSS